MQCCSLRLLASISFQRQFISDIASNKMALSCLHVLGTKKHRLSLRDSCQLFTAWVTCSRTTTSWPSLFKSMCCVSDVQVKKCQQQCCPGGDDVFLSLSHSHWTVVGGGDPCVVDVANRNIGKPQDTTRLRLCRQYSLCPMSCLSPGLLSSSCPLSAWRVVAEHVCKFQVVDSRSEWCASQIQIRGFLVMFSLVELTLRFGCTPTPYQYGSFSCLVYFYFWMRYTCRGQSPCPCGTLLSFIQYIPHVLILYEFKVIEFME